MKDRSSFTVVQGIKLYRNKDTDLCFFKSYKSDYAMFDLNQISTYEHKFVRVYDRTNKHEPYNQVKLNEITVSLTNGWTRTMHLDTETFNEFCEHMRWEGFFGGPQEDDGRELAPVLQLVKTERDKNEKEDSSI